MNKIERQNQRDAVAEECLRLLKLICAKHKIDTEEKDESKTV